MSPASCGGADVAAWQVAVRCADDRAATMQAAGSTGQLDGPAEPDAGVTTVLSRHLLEDLKRRREATVACRALPLTLLLIGLWCPILVLTRDPQTAHELAAATRKAIGEPELRALTNAAGSADAVWSWVAQRANATTAPGMGIVGGIRLARLEEGHVGGRPANPVQALEDEGRGDFLWEALIGEAEAPRLRACCSQDSGASNTTAPYWLHEPFSQSFATPSLAQVRLAWNATSDSNSSSASWLAGGGLLAQMLLKSQGADWYALCEVAFRIDLSGLLYTEIVVDTFDGKLVWMGADGSDALTAVLHVFFVCTVVLLLCTTCVELVGGIVITSFSKRQLLQQIHMWSIWSVNDLLIVALTAVIVITYAHCEHLTKGLNHLTGSLPAVATMKHTGSYTTVELRQDVWAAGFSLPSYEHTLDAMLEQTLRLDTCWGELHWLAPILAACLSLRLFRGLWAAVPRLAVFWSALCVGTTELLNVFVFWGVLFYSFSVVAYVIFGGRLEDFSTSGAAVESTMLFVRGSIDESVLTRFETVGGPLGVVWAWIVGLVFIWAILHSVLAAVLYIYRQEKRGLLEREASPRHRLYELVMGRHEVRPLLPQALAASPLLNNGAARGKRRPHEVALAEKAVRDSLRQAASTWRQRKLLQHLLVRHPMDGDEELSCKSLASRIGATSVAEELVLNTFVEDAARARSRTAARAAAVKKSVRLISRIDANVRDLCQDLYDIASHCNQPDGDVWPKPAAPPAWPSMDTEQQGDYEVQHLTAARLHLAPPLIMPPQPPPPEEAPLLPRQPSGRTTATELRAAPSTTPSATEATPDLRPLPEWHVRQERGVDLEEEIEARVSALEEADAACCARLEQELEMLTQGLTSTQGEGRAETQDRKLRFYLVEKQLEDLSEHVNQLFDNPLFDPA